MPMRRHGELPARNVPRAARASALRGAGTLLGTLNTSLLNIQSLNELTPRRILTHRHTQRELSGKSHARATRTRITMTYMKRRTGTQYLCLTGSGAEPDGEPADE